MRRLILIVLALSFGVTLSAQVVISSSSTPNGGSGSFANLKVDTLVTGANSPEGNAIWHLKTGGATPSAASAQSNLLLSDSTCEAGPGGLTILATGFSTNIYNGLNLYQCSNGDTGIYTGDAAFIGMDAVLGYLQLLSAEQVFISSEIVTITSEASDADDRIKSIVTIDGGQTGNVTGWLHTATSNGAALANLIGASLKTSVNSDNVTTAVHGLESILFTNGTSVIGTARTHYNLSTLDGADVDVTDFYSYYSVLGVGAGSTIVNYYAYYSVDVSQTGITNPYFLWYDGSPGSDCNDAGVWRVDGRGIIAYYNPCFTKYAPAATNFERIILRWGDTGVFGTDNRAYIGVEEGGTGTDRALHLTGANLSFTSTLTPAVTDTSANSCGTGAQTIVGNDNAGKVTVIGSAGTSCTVTFATAFLNAPSCTVTNETTANLARATSTTTTVILAGTFLENDVLAYICLGR